jgi:hypothetical protein
VHGRDPGQAVTGEANYRVWQALRNLPSLVDQAPHRRIVAAHEGIHKLAAESCDERLHIAEPLAQNACTMIRGARLRSGIVIDRDRGRTNRDLEREFAPITRGAFRERS